MTSKEGSEHEPVHGPGAALADLGLQLLDPSSRDELVRVLHRLRTTQQALIIAACAPRWQPVVELALAVALLPARRVCVATPAAVGWRELLDGVTAQAPDHNEVVWVVRGVEGDSFNEGLAGLNFHRDDVMTATTKLWLWVHPHDLERLPLRAPDLWRFRTAVLDVQARPTRRVALPHYLPAIPRSWESLRRATPEEPHYRDDRTRRLGEERKAALGRKEQLVIEGGDTTAVDAELLALRRKLREHGLQPGAELSDGRYLLLEHVGSGGFATVWKAYDRQRQQLVAVKVLHGQWTHDQTRRERLFRGASKMADLSHPGIVRVFERECYDRPHYYFVMEYLPGGDLQAAVRQGRCPPDQALPLITQVGEALQHAHDHGLVHRDVKPANVLLDAQGRPKLTDFDLVRAADTTGGTRTGALGTFLYSAPEVLERAKEADARADVYSLAMTALFVLHGRDLPMVVVKDPGRILDRCGCSRQVKEVLSGALDWDPDERPGSVRELVERLRQAADSPVVEEPAPSPSAEVTSAANAASSRRGRSRERSRRVMDAPDTMATTVHQAIASPRDRSDKVDLLLRTAHTTRDLPALQLLGAGLLAINAPNDALAELRQRAGGALALGIPEVPWPVIPAGSFLMGSPEAEEGRYPDEGPRHPVTVVQPFAMLATPVTQALYLVVTGSNPSHHTGNLRRPVEQVRWSEAVAFCDRLAELQGRPVRLPLEAEWEYASRADSETPFWSGASDADLARVGWYGGNSGRQAHPVAEKPANSWGLYDVHGNVWEWCCDPWVDSYAGRAAGVQLDPGAAPPARDPGLVRVVRGGSWDNSARDCRSAFRLGRDPGLQWLDLGFRVLLPPSPSSRP